MDNSIINKNTAAFRFQVWLSFASSMALTLGGVFYLPVDFWIKGYLLMGIIFTIASCFTLAKAVRDDSDAEKLINRIEAAKHEKIINEYANKV